MNDSRGHRHTSRARQVALPSVTITAALVAVAVVIGEVNLLRAGAVLALVVVVVVAVLFDHELVRDRRAHGLDRANLARAYAVEYAGWIAEQRVLARTAGTPVPATRLETSTMTIPGRGPTIVADDEPAQLWDDIADAPTVVDLVAWEERLRESTGARTGDRRGDMRGPADGTEAADTDRADDTASADSDRADSGLAPANADSVLADDRKPA